MHKLIKKIQQFIDIIYFTSLAHLPTIFFQFLTLYF